MIKWSEYLLWSMAAMLFPATACGPNDNYGLNKQKIGWPQYDVHLRKHIVLFVYSSNFYRLEKFLPVWHWGIQGVILPGMHQWLHSCTSLLGVKPAELRNCPLPFVSPWNNLHICTQNPISIFLYAVNVEKMILQHWWELANMVLCYVASHVNLLYLNFFNAA